MQFEKCLYCPAIKEKKCAGPYFMAMSTKEVVEWAIKYQKIHGITNAQLAEWSGIPKGTIDGIKYRDDVRHDTIYRILKALIEGVGGEWGGETCANQNEQHESLREINKRLEETNQFLKETIDDKQKNILFAHEQIKIRNKSILALSIALGVSVASLIVDLLISHI